MQKRLIPVLALALYFGAISAAAQDSPRIKPAVSYEVDATRPDSGLVHVKMTVENNRQSELEIAFPRWNPGSYRFQDHYKQVSNVRSPHGVRRLDPITWRISAKGPTVTVEYDAKPLGKSFGKDHFSFEGPSLYPYLEGHKDVPYRVTFKTPPGWKVGTGLELRDGAYGARDYDTFIDCPTELGKFDLHSFDVGKVRYEIVVHSDGPYDGKRLVEMCRKIVQAQNRFWGRVPFSRYVFLMHFTRQWGGRGLEHLNSTNIHLSYNYVRRNIWNAASLISHEYFHTWNVKRLRPRELGPFDYTGMVRNRHLWLCEGVTSYYGDLILARTGIWNEDRYFNHLARQIAAHNNNPDRKKTSVERASEVVWDRKDWPRVDYYNKGEVLGLLLDLKIRAATENQKSLDDVMRSLYDTYVDRPSKSGAGPIGIGFEQVSILRALNDISGQDFTDFYRQYVEGTEDLPFKEVLTAAGLEVDLTVTRRGRLPISFAGRRVVAGLSKNPLLSALGLRAGDELVRVNDTEITAKNQYRMLADLKAGARVKLVFQRGKEKLEAWVEVGESEGWQCKVRRAKGATPQQQRLLDSWLGKG